MGSGLIKVQHIVLEKEVELLLMQDEEVIQAFSPHASQKTFTDGIRSRGSVWRAKHLDGTRGRYTRKTRSEFTIIVSNQVFGCLSIRSCLSQLLRDPGIGRGSCHIHVDDLARLQLDDEESKERTEEEVRHLQEIAGPHLCRMITQKRFPVLSTGLFWANLLHILLNRPFTDANIQLEELATDTLRSPKPVVCCHFLDQRNGLKREPRLLRMRFGFVLPEQTEKLTVPAKKRFWLDQEECLFPGSDHSCQEYQEKPVRLFVHWSLDLSAQDDELLPQQRVFRQQFGFASGQVGERSEHKGGRQWFDPPQNTFLEHAQAQTDSLFDRGIYREHEWNLLFMKIGAWLEQTRNMNCIDCTFLPCALTRKLAQ